MYATKEKHTTTTTATTTPHSARETMLSISFLSRLRSRLTRHQYNDATKNMRMMEKKHTQKNHTNCMVEIVHYKA